MTNSDSKKTQKFISISDAEAAFQNAIATAFDSSEFDGERELLLNISPMKKKNAEEDKGKLELKDFLKNTARIVQLTGENSSIERDTEGAVKSPYIMENSLKTRAMRFILPASLSRNELINALKAVGYSLVGEKYDIVRLNDLGGELTDRDRKFLEQMAHPELFDFCQINMEKIKIDPKAVRKDGAIKQ